MAEVTKVNSERGIVNFSTTDLIDHNLMRYIRTQAKGIGKEGLLTDNPFETIAAGLYKEKYPSDQVKLAEKCLLRRNKDGEFSVDVVLRVSEDKSEQYYMLHPTERIFKKEEKKRA